MSKKLDDELAQAIGEGAEKPDDNARSSTPGVAAALPTSEARSDAKRDSNRSTGLLLVLLAMVGGVVALFFLGIKEAAIYASPIDELVKAPAKMVERKVRIEGELTPGSLVKRDQPCEYRFKLRGSTKDIELGVRYAQCVIPDTFRDVPDGGVMVTVEGALSKTGDFEATQVMAKCTSKYDPKTHEMKSDVVGAAADQPIR